MKGDGNFSLHDLERLQSDDFAKVPNLSYEEEMRCIDQAKSGDQVARDRLVLSTLPLVLAISRRFRGKGVSQADIRQAGTIGLISAVDGYVASMGGFSSYAGVCIANEIRQSFREWITVPLPKNLVRKLKDIKEALRVLARKGNLGLSPIRIAEELILTSRYADQPIEDLISVVNSLLPFTFPTISADASIEINDDGSCIALIDTLYDKIDRHYYDKENPKKKIIDTDFNEILIETLFDLGMRDEAHQGMFFGGQGDTFERRNFFLGLQEGKDGSRLRLFTFQSGCPFSRRFRWIVLTEALAQESPD